jgi:hypothetical protein
MSFAVTDHGSGEGTYASSITVSDTTAPAIDSVVVVSIAHDDETMSVSGYGETFTQIGNKVGLNTRDLAIFAAIITSTNTTAVTITGTTLGCWAITTEYEGLDVSGSVSDVFVQSASDAVYNPSSPAWALPTLPSSFSNADNIALTIGTSSVNRVNLTADTSYTQAGYYSSNSDVGAWYYEGEDLTQRLIGSSNAFAYARLVGFAFELAIVTGGGDTSVSGTTDALTLTEGTATISLDVNVSTATDSLTLSTNQAAISLDTNLAATLDALTLSTYTAGISLDVNVLATVDALTLTDNQASIATGSTIPATLDALVLTEHQTAIQLDRNISATTESLTITGNQATVDTGATVSTTSDALTLAEYAASITFDVEVITNTEALTLSTLAASVAQGSIVSASIDALTIATQAASISFDRNVLPGIDALSLTAYAATIGGDKNLTATTDALSLTAYAAIISSDVHVIAPAKRTITTSLDSRTITTSLDSRTITVD